MSALTQQYANHQPTARAPVRVFAEQRDDWTVSLNVPGLQRIFLNVCSNASKHTLATGSIEFRVRLEPASEGANAVIGASGRPGDEDCSSRRS